jgi:hypothetical protein
MLVILNSLMRFRGVFLNAKLELLYIQVGSRQDTYSSGNQRRTPGTLVQSPALWSCPKAVYTQRNSLNEDEHSAYTVVTVITS